MSKQQWVERAAAAARDFGLARDVVDEAAARTLGINRTDLRILGAVYTGGSLSAGAVAEQVGLSPAATTEAVGRLVARNLVARAADPADRRRAVITATAAGTAAVEAVYEPVRAAGAQVLAGYSVAELELIAGFLERGRRMQMEQAARIGALQPLP